MRPYFKFSILLLLWLPLPSLKAQKATDNEIERYTVSGMVLDSVDQTKMEWVTISLVNHRTDSLIAGTYTNRNGQFELKNISQGKYKLRFSYIGYNSAEKVIELLPTSPQKINLGTIALSPSEVKLDEITVVAQVPEMQVREDTVEYNAAAFKVSEGAVVEDLLKRLPGIEVDIEGKITTATGKTIRRVFVDGKEFFGNDPKMATQNLNADMVDKVQVIEKQSDLSILTGVEDDDPETIINITIKKGMKKGWIGNVNGGIGNMTRQPSADQVRYSLNGNANKFSDDNQLSLIAGANNINVRGSTNRQNAISMGRGGRDGGGITSSSVFGINTANTVNDKLKVGGNISYNYGDNDVTRKDNRINFFKNDSTTYRFSNSSSRNFNNNFSIEAKLEYNPDTLTTVIFSPSFSHNWSVSRRSSAQQTHINSEIGETANESFSNNKLNSDGTNIGMRLDISRKLSQKGRRISFSGSFTTSRNNGFDDNISETAIHIPIIRLTQLNQQSHSDANRNASNFRFTYVEPIAKNYSLNFSYNIQRSTTENLRKTFDYDSTLLDYIRLNPEYSKSSENLTTTQNIRVNFRAQLPKYTYNLGINIAPLYINSKSFIADWFQNGIDSVLYDPQPIKAVNYAPQLEFNYRLGDKNIRKNIRLRYNGTTRQPSINQLDPTPNTTNPLNIRTGNPDLLASFIHNGSLEYNYNYREKQRSMTASWNYSYIQNDIVNFTSYEDGIQHTMPINVSGSWNTNGTLLYAGALDKKMKLKFTTHTNIGYRNQIGYTRVSKESQKNISKTSTLSESLSLSYNNDWFYGQFRGTINYSNTDYSLEHLKSQRSFRYNLSYNIQLTLPKSFSISSDIRWTANRGLSAGYNKDEVMWNAQISKSFLKGNRGQLRLIFNDILQQRLNITRSVGSNYLSDSETNALTSYFLLSFSYRMRAMNAGGRGRIGRLDRN